MEKCFHHAWSTNTSLSKIDSSKRKKMFLIHKSHLHRANLLTFLAIILGLWGSVMIAYGNIHIGITLIILWVYCDMFDGYIARKYKLQSQFWSILDSFADILLYIFPIVLIYGRIDWYSLFSWGILSLFILAWCFRLAYFTEIWLVAKWGKLYYHGFPLYLSHIFFIILLIWSPAWLNLSYITIFSLLMVWDHHVPKIGILLGNILIVLLLITNMLSSLWILSSGF